MIKNTYHILESVYGYKSFRPIQESIINTVVAGHDVLALLPTGGGKSICYQIPGLMSDGICIVISPLIALIKDQVSQLKKRGVKAIGLTSGMRYQDLDEALDNAIHGNYEFLYLSPERLRQELVIERIKRMRVGLIAVDEAHCISQWGHDFRPAYREISKLRELLPHVPLIAVTATATTSVKKDILENLSIDTKNVFQSSFERSNINYRVLETPDKRQQILAYLKIHHNESSIIYVRNRKNTVETSSFLEQNDIGASYYHGGLLAKQRDKHAALWMTDKKTVMVSTNAFGMGIDKPNVRHVIHSQLPDSIESYYQETGRAGRDGLESNALFVYNVNDIQTAKRQFTDTLASTKDVKVVYRTLNTYFQIATGEGMDSVHTFTLSQFCERYNLNGLKTYNALQVLDRFSIINLNHGFHNRTQLRFRESGQTIIDFTSNNPVASSIIHAIMRTYGSSTQHTIELNIALVALRSGQTEVDVLQTLKHLEEKQIIEATLFPADSQITFLVPRDDDRTINTFGKELQNQNELKTIKLNALVNLLTQKSSCINKELLAYFDENTDTNCGRCSNCMAKVEYLDLRLLIIEYLKLGEFTSVQIATELKHPVSIISDNLTQLLEQEKITITFNNTYRLI